MECVITAGPTYEPLDEVRRLTNFSTGRLGTELAASLTRRGHHVTLLVGDQSTWCGERKAAKVQIFTTTADLSQRLRDLSGEKIDAIFHAAAVSDFGFGKVWKREADGALRELKSPKLTTREGALLAELVPTQKILASLREWFPGTTLVGWKYEADGGQPAVLAKAVQQVQECRLTACVANGPGYGSGFGLVRPGREHLHVPDSAALFDQLARLLETAPQPGA